MLKGWYKIQKSIDILSFEFFLGLINTGQWRLMATSVLCVLFPSVIVITTLVFSLDPTLWKEIRNQENVSLHFLASGYIHLTSTLSFLANCDMHQNIFVFIYWLTRKSDIMVNTLIPFDRTIITGQWRLIVMQILCVVFPSLIVITILVSSLDQILWKEIRNKTTVSSHLYCGPDISIFVVYRLFSLGWLILHSHSS